MKNNKWGLLREAYIDNSVIVNDLNQQAHTGDDTSTADTGGNMTFFNVVKEAVKKEKVKKERPSLSKFLEKFEGFDIPESVTPNPYENFSHFEQTEDQEDEDLKTLKASLTRVSGTCKELAAPRVREKPEYCVTRNDINLFRDIGTTTGGRLSSIFLGRNSGLRCDTCGDTQPRGWERLPSQNPRRKFLIFVTDFSRDRRR